MLSSISRSPIYWNSGVLVIARDPFSYKMRLILGGNNRIGWNHRNGFDLFSNGITRDTTLVKYWIAKGGIWAAQNALNSNTNGFFGKICLTDRIMRLNRENFCENPFTVIQETIFILPIDLSKFIKEPDIWLSKRKWINHDIRMLESTECVLPSISF